MMLVTIVPLLGTRVWLAWTHCLFGPSFSSSHIPPLPHSNCPLSPNSQRLISTYPHPNSPCLPTPSPSLPPFSPSLIPHSLLLFFPQFSPYGIPPPSSSWPSFSTSRTPPLPHSRCLLSPHFQRLIYTSPQPNSPHLVTPSPPSTHSHHILYPQSLLLSAVCQFSFLA